MGNKEQPLPHGLGRSEMRQPQEDCGHRVRELWRPLRHLRELQLWKVHITHFQGHRRETLPGKN